MCQKVKCINSMSHWLLRAVLQFLFLFLHCSYTVTVKHIHKEFFFWCVEASKKKKITCINTKKTVPVKHYLKNVISRFELSDVDPLAVDVVSVGIPAAHSDALLTEVRAFVSLLNACNKTWHSESNIHSQTLFLVFPKQRAERRQNPPQIWEKLPH